MNSTGLLIDLLGAAAMLLWGLRQLKTGITVAFGAQLRQFIAASTRNRCTAFGAGLVTTLALQSSTAMAVFASSFVAQGLMAPAMAQAVMLGANVGTAVVTQILAFKLDSLAPLAFIAGVFASTRKSRRWNAFGQTAIGLSLMLISLRFMGQATGPMRENEAVEVFFGLLGDAPAIAVVLSAAFAAASASSLAVVLFIMSLASSGSLSAETILVLVAGANLGGAVPPAFAVMGDGIAAKRVTVSNLLVRGLGALLLLAVLGWLKPIVSLVPDLARLTVLSHIGFNVALAIIFLPLVEVVTRISTHLLPENPATKAKRTRHLDDQILLDPVSALAAATRETLILGDLVEAMLETSFEALRNNDERLCQSLPHLDDEVDKLEEAIKLYLARIDLNILDATTEQEIGIILDYAVNLEHIGDIIERSLSRLTLKKIEKRVQYSSDGFAEIEGLFSDTLENLRLAQRVFLSRDVKMAHRLMESKIRVRRTERASLDHHMLRLRERRTDSLETTSLHVDVLRDLKHINGHLASVAVPILEGAGLLRESRLRKN